MKATLTASDLFSSGRRVDVLRVLWGVKVPLTAADVARRTRMTHPGASAILRTLTGFGLVSSSPAGRGYTYWLNRDSVYVRFMLDPVFDAEHEIPERMLEAIRLDFERRNAVSAVLFGSYARGDQDEESDIDVIVVAPDAETKDRIDNDLDDLYDGFARSFGARLSAIVYDRYEAATLQERAPGLYDSLIRDGIRLFGLDVTEWKAHGT